METKPETVLSSQTPGKSSGYLKYSLYLFAFFSVLGIGVYLYMRKISNDLKREVNGIHPQMIEETDEQIEDRIKEMQKYLLHHPSE